MSFIVIKSELETGSATTFDREVLGSRPKGQRFVERKRVDKIKNTQGNKNKIYNHLKSEEEP